MGDRIFKAVIAMFAGVIALLVIALAVVLAWKAGPALRGMGVGFLLQSVWDPVTETYGILPLIFGTIVSSMLALLMAAPVGVGIAVFLTELAPRPLATVVGFLVELLAAIPSVIFGLWGILYLVPFLRSTVEPWLIDRLGSIPLFEGPPYGVGMLAAGIILAVMILPIISAICRDVLTAVPREQREAAYALGATRREMVRTVVLRYARPGIMGAVFLGLGRALGETMAVTMVIGNRPEIAKSLFAPAQTMASLIANEFAEATTDHYMSALMAVALMLFLVTLVVNGAARLLVNRGTHATG